MAAGSGGGDVLMVVVVTDDQCLDSPCLLVLHPASCQQQCGMLMEVLVDGELKIMMTAIFHSACFSLALL